MYQKLEKTSDAYQKWKADHLDCKADFKGSAPAMEPEGAEEYLKDRMKSTASIKQSILVMVTVKAIRGKRMYIKIQAK